MTPAHPAHPVTLLRLRDAIASGARRLDPPGPMGVPAVIMDSGVAPGSPSRMKDAR